MQTSLSSITGHIVISALILLLICPWSHAVAQQSGSADPQPISQGSVMDAQMAIEVALANNTEIKRALLDIEDADQQVRLAWGEYLPEVNGSASYTRNLEIPVNFIPAVFFNPSAGPDELVPVQFGTDNEWRGSISASQVIFRGETIVGINSAELFRTAQKESFRATSQQVVTQTRKAFNNVLIAEEQLRLRESSLERIRENLEENRARYKAGLIDEFEVLRLEVQLSNEEPLVEEAAFQLDQAFRNLSLTIGINVNFQYDVKGDLNAFKVKSLAAQNSTNNELKSLNTKTELILKDEQTNELTSQADNLRGDLRVLDYQEKLKLKEIRAVKSRFLPSLTSNYTLSWNAAQPGSPVFFGTDDTRARAQLISLTLNVPIFQGLQRLSNLNRRQIEMKDINEQQYFARKHARNEIFTTQDNIKRIYKTAEARERAIEQARRGYEIARARFDNGVGSQLDVTNAELQLRQAETNYAQMVFEYLNAKADYDLAVGMVPYVNN